MVLFIFAAVLTLTVVGALVRPLLRDMTPPAPAEPFNVAVYRDQLRELSAEDARFCSATPAYSGGAQAQASARAEIERRLLTALRRTPAAEATTRAAPVGLAMVLAAGLTLGGGVIYLAVGEPMLHDQPLKREPSGASATPASPAPPATASDGAHAGLDQMVASLSRKLQTHSDDPDGWALLARSLMRMDRPAAAVDAYRQARTHTRGANAQLDAEYAEARVIAGDGTVDTQALGVFQRLLAADPANPQARYYIALAEVQVGDVSRGLTDWRALQAASPANAPWMATLRQRIADAEGALRSASPAQRAAAPAPSEAAVVTALPDAERSKAIDAMVDSLAARLQRDPDDLNGWRELAQADVVLGRRDQAALAQRQIRRLERRIP